MGDSYSRSREAWELREERFAASMAQLAREYAKALTETRALQSQHAALVDGLRVIVLDYDATGLGRVDIIRRIQSLLSREVPRD